MEVLKRKDARALIGTADTVEKADKILTEMVGLMSVKEKIAFLLGMFDARVYNKNVVDYDEVDYYALLHMIVTR